MPWPVQEQVIRQSLRNIMVVLGSK